MSPDWHDSFLYFDPVLVPFSFLQAFYFTVLGMITCYRSSEIDSFFPVAPLPVRRRIPLSARSQADKLFTEFSVLIG